MIKIFKINTIGIKILEIENNQKVLGSAPTIIYNKIQTKDQTIFSEKRNCNILFTFSI